MSLGGYSLMPCTSPGRVVSLPYGYTVDYVSKSAITRQAYYNSLPSRLVAVSLTVLRLFYS
jgi:hypothetical protein